MPKPPRIAIIHQLCTSAALLSASGGAPRRRPATPTVAVKAARPRPLPRERQSKTLGGELETRPLGRARHLDDHPVLIPHHGHVSASGGRSPHADCHVVPRKVLE